MSDGTGGIPEGEVDTADGGGDAFGAAASGIFWGVWQSLHVAVLPAHWSGTLRMRPQPGHSIWIAIVPPLFVRGILTCWGFDPRTSTIMPRAWSQLKCLS